MLLGNSDNFELVKWEKSRKNRYFNKTTYRYKSSALMLYTINAGTS